MTALATPFDRLGTFCIGFMNESGRLAVLFARICARLLRRPFDIKNILKQMEEVGFNSIPVIAITGAFTRMVLALQSYTGFKRVSAEAFVGTVVSPSMTRALYTLATDPIKYLMVPRFWAALIMLPVLTVCADIIGIIGGYAISVGLLGSNATIYMRRTWDYMEYGDVYSGLLKAAIFGMIIATVSCYQGFYTQGGAEGVGRATTKAVVVSCLLILVANYFITAFLF
jgi:phospholipid/cholesterol/gamma-HCH transport system permease protein